MVFCGNITVKSYSDTKVYLKGTVTGLDSSKKYCLHYFDWGDKNLPNKTYSYTFIKNKTSFDLGSAGCYVPRSAWPDGEQMEIRCNEIGTNCEDITKNVCGEVLRLDIVQDQYVYYVVEDDEGNKVSNARIECYGDVLYTGTDGRASHILNEGKTYYATCYPPTGYECVDCYESFTVTGTTIIDFTVKRSEEPEPEPEPEPEECYVDFAVLEVTGKGFLPGVLCEIGGKSGRTGSGGTCRISGLACGQTYTATCVAPHGYTCSCTGCKCSDGPFPLLYPGGAVDTFYLKEIEEEPKNCQQDFKVVDQDGNPVRGAFLEAEDQINYETFPIGGHANTGTLADGSISTLNTIQGATYKFYISVYPGGYCYDPDGVSIVERVACTPSEIVFRMKKLISDCPVNFCVRNQEGTNMPGVVININNDVGAISTKHDIDCFGCTGQIGLECGVEYTASIRPTEAYTCDPCSKTFTPTGPMDIFFDVIDPMVIPKLSLTAPSIAIAGEIELSGTAPPGEIVEIVAKKSFFGFDFLVKDTVLTSVSSKTDGTYGATITLDEFGAIDVYARIRKEGWLGIGFLEKDIVSETHTIWVITTPILIGLIAIVALIAEKRFNFVGVFK